MSYLAAVLCLNTLDEFSCFQCLANLLLRDSHLFAFFRLDGELIQKYYAVFEQALSDHKPTANASRQLREQGVHPQLYLFNWFQTLFLKVTFFFFLKVANNIREELQALKL